MMMKAVRSLAVFLVVAVLLPAQKLSVLHSLDAGSRAVGTQGAATDSTGIYMVNLSGRRFVLHKLDPAGNELWINRSEEAQWITASVTVAAGGVYVAGVVEGEASGQTGAGGFDIYVARYDGNGKQLWMRQFGTSGDEEGGGISADSSGIYVTSATWVFAQQNYAASLRKYSPDGDLLWTRELAGLAFWWMPVAADGAGLYLASATRQDAFLRKYNGDGDEQWTRRFTAQRPGISGLAADHSGVYAVLDSYSGSGNDSSVRKYDAEGNELWASALGAFANPALPLRALTADATGLYVSGLARTSLPAQCYAGSDDAVVRKLDTTTGREIWTREFGTSAPDPVAGLAANDNGVFVLAGGNLARLVSDPVAVSVPRIRNECVLNAASNIGGGVAPGEIVTVVVTGRVTRLLFNGIPAPVLAASDTGITSLVPFEVADQRVVDVQVESQIESQRIVSEAVKLPVLTDRLGVFSADGSGNGQAAIVNEDGTLNDASHPARPGSAISIYATGGGPNAIAVAISSEIKAYPEVDGGAEDYRYYAPILYAGVTGGLLQINVQVPAGVPSGSAVPLHITSRGIPIEQSLTIAIAQ